MKQIKITTSTNEIINITVNTGPIDLLISIIDENESVKSIDFVSESIKWQVIENEVKWTFVISQQILRKIYSMIDSDDYNKITIIKYLKNVVVEETGYNTLGLLEAKCLVEKLMKQTDIKPNVPFQVYNW